jgi:hypothetical protein
MRESSAFFFRYALLFFALWRYEAVMIISTTTKPSIAEASAAKKADEKLIRSATLPNGTPLSVRATVGATVQQ